MKKADFVCSTFELMSLAAHSREKHDFPTRKIKFGSVSFETYIIPKEKKQEIINQVNSLGRSTHPSTERSYHISIRRKMFDSICKKAFYAKDFIVIWYANANHLASPFFAESGAASIDCVNYKKIFDEFIN